MVVLVLKSTIFALALAASFINSYAQTTKPFSPPRLTRPAYATLNNVLYIQGGSTDANSAALSLALFSLDLNQPWNVNNPPWKSLASSTAKISAPLAWQHTMTKTLDNSTLVVWDASHYTIATYNTKTDSWTSSITYSTTNPNWGGFQAVVDPTSTGMGTIMVPNGCFNPAVGSSVMCTYGTPPSTFGATQLPIVPKLGKLPENITFYQFVRSTQRNSLMLFGGWNGTAYNTNLYEYLLTSKTWSLLQPQGTGPGALFSFCMVETSDGSSMIVFGGVSLGAPNGGFVGDLFILNLKDLTWTQGTRINSPLFRTGPACGTNGDSFVVWGGHNISSLMSTTPMIYNIAQNLWVDDFVVSGPLPTTVSGPLPTTVSGPLPTTVDQKSSNNGAIIGGVVSGVVVLAAVAVGLLFYRRQRSNKNPVLDQHTSPTSRTEISMRGGGGGGGDAGVGDSNGYNEFDDKKDVGERILLQDTNKAAKKSPLALGAPTFIVPEDNNKNNSGDSSIHSSSPQYFTRLDQRGESDSDSGWPRGPQQISKQQQPFRQIPQRGQVSWVDGSRQYYFPPPSPQRPHASPTGPIQTSWGPDDDLMHKQLALLKAQHEFNLERIRVEQKEQREAIERQLKQMQ